MGKFYKLLLLTILVFPIGGYIYKETIVWGIGYELFDQNPVLKINFESFKKCAEEIRTGNKACEKNLQKLFHERDSAIAEAWPRVYDTLASKPYWTWVYGDELLFFRITQQTKGQRKLRNECVPVIKYMYTQGRTTFNFAHLYKCSDDEQPRPPSGGLSFCYYNTVYI